MSRAAHMIDLCKAKEQTDYEKPYTFWKNKRKDNWFCNRELSPLRESGIATRAEDSFNFPSESEDSPNNKNLTNLLYSPDVEKISDSQGSKIYTDLIPVHLKSDYSQSPENEKNIPRTSPKIKIIENIILKINANADEQSPEREDEHSPERDDNSRDPDFNVNQFVGQSSSSAPSDTSDISENEEISQSFTKQGSFSEQIKQQKHNSKKHIRCKFCEDEVISTNFMRHLQRHHMPEKEVESLLRLPNKSKIRRDTLALLRNDTNFNLFLTGTMRAKRKVAEIIEDVNYQPCAYCRGLFRKTYLKRHAKLCIARKSANIGNTSSKNGYLSASQTVVACAIDPTQTIAKLNIKDKVFSIMKGDEIAFQAKKDLLIANFGESYLKKHKKENLVYACSNRMRELARLLIQYRQIINKPDISFNEILHPKNFDTVLLATRETVGYNPERKSFKAPSLAMHLGTSLKLACDELTHLILKDSRGFECKSSTETQECLKNVKNFKKLVESRWNTEIASLASKDLTEKKWTRSPLLPLVNDIKIFREECTKIATDCENKFVENKDDAKTYSKLVQCALSLLIIFNRRRIGDVQFLKITDYNNETESNFADFQSVLSETEKMLATKYKRVVNSGKGSREVVILIPEILQSYINLLLKQRGKYIPLENDYVFALPGSKVPWGKGDVAIRTLAKGMKLENPRAITSNKLRKHIATVTQILNLTPEEAKQFSTFMGHTEKTHKEFYELPIDIYQTAKVSKLLLLMEKGSLPLEYKGKSLGDIHFNSNLEYALESDNDDEVPLDDVMHHIPGTSGIQLKTKSKQPRKENIESAHQTNEDVDKTLDTKRPRTSYGNFSELSMENQEVSNSETESVPKKINVPKKYFAKKKVIMKNQEESDSETENVPNRNFVKKRGWSTRETSALKTAFNNYLRKKIYPPSHEIKAFLEKTAMNRSIVVVKAKLQHFMKQM